MMCDPAMSMLPAFPFHSGSCPSVISMAMVMQIIRPHHVRKGGASGFTVLKPPVICPARYDGDPPALPYPFILSRSR